MFGLIDSLVDLTVDVARIATAPVEVVVDLTGQVVKPVAEVAQDIVDAVKR